ncbi:MAG TPA: HEAT repeat domain-containing protein [Armatimonadetes bacterium]|nr:HEAT repeat domain-containing protein [Armatimonadota bacterium]
MRGYIKSLFIKCRQMEGYKMAKDPRVIKGIVTRMLRSVDGKTEEEQEQTIERIISYKAKAIEPLGRALVDGGSFQMRMVAAICLGQLGHPGGIKPLMHALTDSSINVQRVAAEALISIGEPAIPRLVEGLEHEDARVRRWCAYILGRIKRKSAARYLINRVYRETGEVQRAIVIALGELGSKRAQPILLDLLRNSPNIEIQRCAAEALGKVGDRKAVPALIEGLESASYEVRKASSEALVRIGADAVSGLTRALKHPLQSVRNTAARALGRLQDRRAVKGLIKALKDENVQVRQSVAQALGRIGDRSAFRHLSQLLHDPNHEVRFSAVMALVSVGGSMAASLLREALHDSDWLIRLTAAQGLGQLGDTNAVDLLCRALRDLEWSVRFHAARALGQIGDRRALVSLIRALFDSHIQVKQAAIEALGQLGDMRAVDALRQVAAREPAELRAMAMKAINKILQQNVPRKRRAKRSKTAASAVGSG